MKQKPYVVIMAGGIGSRFWPYSRNNHPKQFLDILGTGRTLLQMTFDRFVQISDPDRFFVVTNDSYFDLVKEQLPEMPEDHILTEPMRRNTAACIAFASYKIKKLDPEARVVVTPADHLILKDEKFQLRVNDALDAADENERLVTIGIKPNRPETGYGYIQFMTDTNGVAKKVKTFTEKPNLNLAKTFVESGDFVWNSGMFVWKNSSILKAFEKYMPELAEVFEEGEGFFYTDQEQEFIKRAYSLVKNISIDYGVMEKSENVFVVLGDFGWSDLGSWMSLHELQPHDDKNNVVEGNALLYDTSNSFVKVNSDKLVVVQGLDNYLITEADNVLLICKLDAEKKFREFVSDAKSRGEEFV
ncbi:mannose-1-phosphate guanylyltransferase [Litoribacter ruber]|uniref:mannose-1-phosphate guanylyltransferase n=1 Tax=Litoribacter ruber TaxID=702568 RepID=A0AAP2CHU3_9BACT|nr:MULTISPECIES: mannose-1-phosphate guanylyltransferase [Litoribacter]MBS9522825.1 mannose-1-phosphate guanylyltransferase [Litoribacter alkaliphilus]MBT0812332.1 mannose-1-phosphate guanylyltransferase [Litoribacter ruber]